MICTKRKLHCSLLLFSQSLFVFVLEIVRLSHIDFLKSYKEQNIISATFSHFHLDFSFPLRILLSCPAMPWPWTVVAGYPWHRWRHWHGDWFLLALWDGWIHCALDGTFTGFYGALKFNLQGNLLSMMLSIVEMKAHEKLFVNWGEELVSALSVIQHFRITPRYPMVLFKYGITYVS